MATRRAIKGVLQNFLGTYVSRYSDYDGYLLFEFLVSELGELKVNLLGQSVSDPDSPVGVAVLSAIAKFADQRQKAGLTAAQVRDAYLTMQRLPGLRAGEVNGQSCEGYNVRFLVEAVMNGNGRYEQERAIFIAPHEAKVGRRSMRRRTEAGP